MVPGNRTISQKRRGRNCWGGNGHSVVTPACRCRIGSERVGRQEILGINTVPLAQQNLEPVAGAGQVSTGQAFQPVVVRVTDSSSPPNPVLAAPISFLMTILRPEGTSGGGGGETNSGNSGMPVILSVTESNTTTDVNGLASIVPTGGSFSPPLEVDVLVTAATGASLDEPLQLFPSSPGDADSSKPVRRSASAGQCKPSADQHSPRLSGSERDSAAGFYLTMAGIRVSRDLSTANSAHFGERFFRSG